MYLAFTPQYVLEMFNVNFNTALKTLINTVICFKKL